MFLPRDPNQLSRGFSPRNPTGEKSSFKSISNSAKRALEDNEPNESVTKKRKLLGILP